MPLSLYGDARNDAALIDSAAMSESSIAAAKIAAAKCAAINAKLAARGKTIETKLLVKLPTTVAGPTDPYSAEIMINDLQNRGLILKSQVQELICQWSGVSLVTRGRYLTATDKSRHLEKPLFIHISGSEVEGVKRAVHHVLATLSITSVPEGSKYDGTIDQRLLKVCERDAADAAMPFVEKVYCGRGDLLIPDNMRERCVGPQSTFLTHIMSCTGSRVTLKGKGSGHVEPETGREAFEPLFFQINHATLEGMVETKKLIDSLLLSVHNKIRSEVMGQSVTQYEQPKPVTSYPTQQTYPQQATHATAYPNPNPERYSLSQGIDPKFSNGRGPTNRTNSRFDIPASGEADHRRNSGHRANSRFDTGSNGNSRQRLVAGHVLTGFTRQPNHPSGEDTLKEGLEKVRAVKRRFTEAYQTDSKKGGRNDDRKRIPAPGKTEEDMKMMPPPGPPLPKPTKQVNASNVASWVMDAITPKQPRSLEKEGRDYNNLTLDYEDSDSD